LKKNRFGLRESEKILIESEKERRKWDDFDYEKVIRFE